MGCASAAGLHALPQVMGLVLLVDLIGSRVAASSREVPRCIAEWRRPGAPSSGAPPSGPPPQGETKTPHGGNGGTGAAKKAKRVSKMEKVQRKKDREEKRRKKTQKKLSAAEYVIFYG